MDISSNVNYLLCPHALIIRTPVGRLTRCYYRVCTTLKAVMTEVWITTVLNQLVPEMYSSENITGDFCLKAVLLHNCRSREDVTPCWWPPSIVDRSVRSWWYIVVLIKVFSLLQDISNTSFLITVFLWGSCCSNSSLTHNDNHNTNIQKHSVKSSFQWI